MINKIKFLLDLRKYEKYVVIDEKYKYIYYDSYFKAYKTFKLIGVGEIKGELKKKYRGSWRGNEITIKRTEKLEEKRRDFHLKNNSPWQNVKKAMENFDNANL